MAWMLMAAAWIAPVGAIQPSEPFADAQSVPADVSLYLHIEDGASMRRTLAQRPIGTWIQQLVDDSALGAAWTALAKSSALEPDVLFDAVLGKQFTLVTRAEAGSAQWAVITTVPRSTMKNLRSNWRLASQLPRHGLALSAMPEQALLVAEDGNTVVFGSRDHPALFNEIIASLGKPLADSLADTDAFAERTQRLNDQSGGLFLRHNSFTGGSSLIGLNVSGNVLRLRHVATFDHPPFERPVSTTQCNYTTVRNFEREQLLTIMEPTDIGISRFETFAMQYLGEALGGADLQQATGDCRIIAIGEEDGLLRDVPEDILTPVPAICVKVDAEQYSVEQLDQQMSRFAARLNDASEGAMLIEVPPLHVYRTGNHARAIDISEAVSTFTGGFPIMKTLTLNWDVADGADGTWCVVAGSPEQLETVCRSLKAKAHSGPELIGTFDSVGTVNGLRMGRQLATWARQAHSFVAPDQQEQFRQAVGLAAGLFESADRIRWQMSRPDAKQMLLDVDVMLRESPSAAGGE